MEGKIATQRARPVAKTGMNTLTEFSECFLDIPCIWVVDALRIGSACEKVRELVRRFELNLCSRPI